MNESEQVQFEQPEVELQMGKKLIRLAWDSGAINEKLSLDYVDDMEELFFDTSMNVSYIFLKKVNIINK